MIMVVIIIMLAMVITAIDEAAASSLPSLLTPGPCLDDDTKEEGCPTTSTWFSRREE